jgi:peptidoglycan-associated lipoprotein
MKTRNSTWIPSAAALGTALALLAGCDTAPKLNAPAAAAPVETRRPVAMPATGAPAATTAATPQSSVATVDLARNGSAGSVAGAGATGSKPAPVTGGSAAVATGSSAAVAGTAMMAMPSQRVVYFDFDSYAIKDDFKSLIDGYARALQTNRGKKLVVEGHTDERGGREYNLALGQKRAAAVVSSLTLLGASDTQLEAVSFGEERPAVQGSDETAWSKNRRAELKDR